MLWKSPDARRALRSQGLCQGCHRPAGGLELQLDQQGNCDASRIRDSSSYRNKGIKSTFKPTAPLLCLTNFAADTSP
jgi:hypothetical protein